MIDNTNTNVESTVEEMRIFKKNNVRGLQLSNVPYTTDGFWNEHTTENTQNSLVIMLMAHLVWM